MDTLLKLRPDFPLKGRKLISNYIKFEEISGRVIDGNGAGLVNRQVELVFKTKEGLTFTIPVYGETVQYGVYDSSPTLCGSGLRVQAKVINAD